MSTKTRATIEDLYKVPDDGKAEIVNVVLMSPTGDAPNYAAGEIFASLREIDSEIKSVNRRVRVLHEDILRV